ncbi:MAG: hypothetical protein ACAI35_16505 [Candidatus Methylacidiphilales bacterium]|nr:hypothetical protein [Candidatus Methylacidiphilales bacterium]
MTKSNRIRPVANPATAASQGASPERLSPEEWERERISDAQALPSPFKPAVPTPLPPPMCRKDGTSL